MSTKIHAQRPIVVSASGRPVPLVLVARHCATDEERSHARRLLWCLSHHAPDVLFEDGVHLSHEGRRFVVSLPTGAQADGLRHKIVDGSARGAIGALWLIDSAASLVRAGELAPCAIDAAPVLWRVDHASRSPVVAI